MIFNTVLLFIIWISFQKSLFEWNSDSFIQSTPLFISVKKGNLEIVKLLLSNPEVDVNIKSILNTNHFINNVTK